MASPCCRVVLDAITRLRSAKGSAETPPGAFFRVYPQATKIGEFCESSPAADEGRRKKALPRREEGL